MTLVYFLLLELLILGAILYWPMLAKDLARKAGIVESLMPAEFLKRMVRSWSLPDSEFAYRAYIATQQFFKGVNVVGIACAVLLGTSTIARERESGTLELLLSRPISRGRILWSKTWVLAICLVVPIYLSSLSIIPLSKWVSSMEVDPSAADLVMRVPAPELIMASTHASLFVLLFFAGAIVFSAMFRTQMHVAFVVGGLIVLEVGIYFIQVIRYGSIFMLADHDIYSPIMAGNVHFGSLFLGTGIWIALSVVLLYGIAHWRFKRMDL